MLCEICWRMLRSQEGRIWKGTYDLHFRHHQSAESLQQSVQAHCGICRVLLEGLKFDSATHKTATNTQVVTTASLAVPNPYIARCYRLDFQIESDAKRTQRTFVLREIGDAGNPHFRTPMSDTTQSDEVYELARTWMSKCRCLQLREPQAVSKDKPWCPARLVDLSEVRGQNWLDTRKLRSYASNRQDIKVRVVEMDEHLHEISSEKNRLYVTLSHCWGETLSEEQEFAQLNDRSLADFQTGIMLNRLPKTFRDAITFASRLPGVGFIWIDSLCIKQGDQVDWLKQSATMDKIYQRAFLNISATAAKDGSEGLFFKRQPETLLEDEVILNIAGLPGALAAMDMEEEVPETLTATSATDKIGNYIGSFETAFPTDLRRCTILNASFWTDRVDEAPVNKRGWVLQERLMAPRVLHFCRELIAWECAEFEFAEGQPEGMEIFQLAINSIRKGNKLKGLTPQDGKALRKARLQARDPDPHLRPQVYVLELWRRIVQVYSRTEVKNPEDKLIALSGIARWMSREVEQAVRDSAQSTLPCLDAVRYVAGLWQPYLESQLLWYVEPTFRNITGDFLHFTTAPEGYRAPSFSWACINAHRASGIKYAEVTDQDILLNIEKVEVQPKDGSDEFGLLEKAAITLRGQLREVVLFPKDKGRYSWRLVGRGDLDKEEHTIVYLDCQDRDRQKILGHDRNVFIMPAAKGDRVAPEQSKYLICLILQRVGGKGVYRRVGITKLSPYGDPHAMDGFRILEPSPSDGSVSHLGYDAETGTHRVVLI